MYRPRESEPDDAGDVSARGARFRLLAALPSEGLPEDVRLLLDADRSEVPERTRAARPLHGSGVREIVSPVSHAETASQADEDILGLFDRRPDATGYHDPADRRSGGSRQASGQFKEFAKPHPDRVAAPGADGIDIPGIDILGIDIPGTAVGTPPGAAVPQHGADDCGAGEAGVGVARARLRNRPAADASVALRHTRVRLATIRTRFISVTPGAAFGAARFARRGPVVTATGITPRRQSVPPAGRSPARGGFRAGRPSRPAGGGSRRGRR